MATDTTNFLGSCTVTDPYGYSSECAEFTIYDVADAFGLKDITSSGFEYTISFWLKSDVSGVVRTTGGTFETDSVWTKCVSTFTADSSDFVFSFDTAGTYYIYHPQLELGNKATDWSPAPEDMATNESVNELSTKYSELEQTVDSFKVTVSETYATKTTVSEVSNAASKAQTTADTAVTNASKAQTTADTAVTNASKAQTTADTAVTNASKAQSAADKAQEDVDTLTTTVSENYATKASVEITASNITQTVSKTYSTKEEVAAIKIGAKNLIRNSETLMFSGYYFEG